LRVYAGDPEEYYTLITPEAYKKLEQEKMLKTINEINLKIQLG
jgi:hypothetical protein